MALVNGDDPKLRDRFTRAWAATEPLDREGLDALAGQLGKHLDPAWPRAKAHAELAWAYAEWNFTPSEGAPTRRRYPSEGWPVTDVATVSYPGIGPTTDVNAVRQRRRVKRRATLERVVTGQSWAYAQILLCCWAIAFGALNIDVTQSRIGNAVGGWFIGAPVAALITGVMDAKRRAER